MDDGPNSSSNSPGSEVRWLVPPLLPTLGNAPVRRQLMDAVESIRRQLDGQAAIHGDPLTPFRGEVGYLHYPAGGFYRRHFDTPAGPVINRRGRLEVIERRVSFLLYLNRGWDPANGGQLRAFPALSEEEAKLRRQSRDALPRDSADTSDAADAAKAEHGSAGSEGSQGSQGSLASQTAQAVAAEDGGSPFLDIDPEGGTLVIFRSNFVEHEVLATTAPRQAVVGWLRGPNDQDFQDQT